MSTVPPVNPPPAVVRKGAGCFTAAGLTSLGALLVFLGTWLGEFAKHLPEGHPSAPQLAASAPALAPQVAPVAPQDGVKAAPAAVPRAGAAPRSPRGRSLGWVRPAQPANHALVGFRRFNVVRTSNPARVDWRSVDSPICDQGSLGSCTGNSWAGAVQFWMRRAGRGDFAPSRLAIYYQERQREGTTCCDDGASVQDGGIVVSSLGTAAESLWPYDVSRFNVAPPAAYLTASAANKVPAPQSVDTTDLDEVRTALANGQMVTLGFDAYASFDDVGKDGAYTPGGSYLGGHAIDVLGYDDGTQRVICRNSWGTDWGAAGYFTASYAWLKSASVSDAWTIPAASPTPAPAPAPDPVPTPTPPTPGTVTSGTPPTRHPDLSSYIVDWSAGYPVSQAAYGTAWWQPSRDGSWYTSTDAIALKAYVAQHDAALKSKPHPANPLLPAPDPKPPADPAPKAASGKITITGTYSIDGGPTLPLTIPAVPAAPR